MLADLIIFIIAILAVETIGVVAMIVIMVATIVSLIVRAFKFQEEESGSGGETLGTVTDGIRVNVIEIFEEAKSSMLAITKGVNTAEKTLTLIGEYNFCSFQRTLETANYLAIENAFPQIA